MPRGSEDAEILHKKNFRIGEVAQIAEVEPSVLRFWETQFKGLRPHKSKSNQRIYSQADVQLVLTIRDLLYIEGFTIEGARRQLCRQSQSGSTDSQATRLVLERVRKEALELLRLVEE